MPRTPFSLAMVWTLAAAGTLHGGPPEDTRRPAVIDRRLSRAVTRAVEVAHDKLARPDCGRVLGEFNDRSGRPLTVQLDALGLSAPDYLRRLVFYDGSRHRPCRDPDVHAFTSPGSRIVYVCERQFREKVQRDSGLGGVYVIHELLHSLGLGENPPLPADITRRVVARCGR
jgi:hypothetical protein